MIGLDPESISGTGSRRRCLATAEPGDTVRIRRIHFEVVRDLCRELGIREGDELRCLRRTANQVVVEFPECHTVALEPQYAQFVEVYGSSDAELAEEAAAEGHVLGGPTGRGRAGPA